MLRRIIYSVVLAGILGGTALAALTLGYLSHREQIQPFFSIGERGVVKGRRMLGLPTITHGLVEHLETAYLTLRGKVYLMPNNEFSNGGALALWDDEVIILHGTGKIFVLEEGNGMIKTDLPVPDNNVPAYIELAASKYPDQFAKAGAIRYNDIEFLDTETFRGLLLSYTYIDVENECYRTRISTLAISEDVTELRDAKATKDDWKLLYQSNPCLMFNETRELIVGYMAGGRMAFKEPNLLYLGNGEFHREGLYRPDAGIQSDDSDYGKTIEINMSTGTSRPFSKGHRNLQGVTLDAEGRLWTTEHGMRGGDELNLVKDQENYGWPLENLGTLYSGIAAPTEGRVGRHEIYQAPVFAWTPSIAVSSLALIDGFHEAWDGDLLMGTLKNRTLYRVRVRDERIVFIEPIPIGQRIRDVMQVGEKKLALWLDTEEVVILEIEERLDPLEGLVDGLVAEGMSPEMADTAFEVLTGCNECHSYQENIHGAGPSLYIVADRKIASTAFASYSEALSAKSGSWDRDSLTAYLTKPEDYVPGTAMSGLGIGNPEVAAAVVSGFEWLGARSVRP